MSSDEEERIWAYVTHLRDEHRHLRECLEDVERRWQPYRQRRGAAGDQCALIASLTSLRAVLAHHLAEEEAGGCVEEAVIHASYLSRTASELEHEDPVLLEQIDRLIQGLQTTRKSIGSLEKQYRQLVKGICDHATAESRIVEESFGTEVD
jgi:hemerythrin superfamily protein